MRKDESLKTSFDMHVNFSSKYKKNVYTDFNFTDD